MTRETKALWADNKLAIAILILLLTTLISAIPGAAILDSRVDDVEEAIPTLEGRVGEVEKHVVADEQAAIDVNRRLRSIEQKLDQLLARD
jgi:hypothetical protein